MSRVLRAARGNILTSTEKPTNSKADPQTNPPPHSTQRSEPPREKGGSLTCSAYKRSGGSSGFSPPGPAFRPQTEYLSVVAWGEVAGPDFRV